MESIKEIYVVDIETTTKKGDPNIAGYPTDKILELGICKVDLETENIIPIYDSVINQDMSDYKDSWIIFEGYKSITEIENGNPIEEVSDKVNDLLTGKHVTSYNTEYDFKNFLLHPPFELKCHIMPCIMEATRQYLKIGHRRDPKEYVHVNLKQARYRLLGEENLPTDPYHTAKWDAKIAGKILVSLHNIGYYTPKIEHSFESSRNTQQTNGAFCEDCDSLFKEEKTKGSTILKYCIDCLAWKEII